MLKNKLIHWVELYQSKPLYGARLWFIIKYYFPFQFLITGSIAFYIERVLQHRINSLFDFYKLDSAFFLMVVFVGPFIETWLFQ
ncbi:hypothetical protein HME7025_00677 [Aquirufa nivalisilvae]|uniref:Uncharacterized protein n=1 Tax=Aquirufa nivalisilvae TaxID=2516557 RepID=A0A2S2DTC5_9BACT|nr:hypothetical protein HME7025_00677 [Aquirufa nivalisilvae]